MTAHQPIATPVFPADTLATMEELYPAGAGLLHHRLPDHPLLSIEALAVLGEGLPAAQVEYNPGDVPIGILPEDVPSNGLSIGETIRTIDTNRSWAVLKNIESVPAYRDLLMALLGELQPHGRWRLGGHPRGCQRPAAGRGPAARTGKPVQAAGHL